MSVFISFFFFVYVELKCMVHFFFFFTDYVLLVSVVASCAPYLSMYI